MAAHGQKQDTSPRPAFRDRGDFFSRPWVWLVGLLALTALLYMPGLDGPFLFDDPPNIVRPFTAWLSGDIGWREVVFGNHSGMFGRPIAMLTFLGNAAISGLAVMPFKLTNLATHLFCGALIYALLSRLLTRDPQLRTRASLVALIVCALWLLHPIQVSTVLYVVQRMAQLSALFMLLGLLAFVTGRLALEAGHRRKGLLYLFIVVPAATMAAVFSKENGALVPLLCAVIELGYFRPIAGTRRAPAAKAFFALFLLLPGLVALYWFGVRHSLTGSYDTRLFTLGERLLSEARVMIDYMGALLLPRGPSLGVYTDDFVTSHGLLDPPSTLLAIIALVALVAAAWWSRTRIPAFFVGIGLYLAGHAMESTVFPLQLYFEHRNYLPSFGFFLALVGLGSWAAARVVAHSEHPVRARRGLAVAGGALLLVLGTATAARSFVWGSMATIAAQGARKHPQSMRAQLDHAQSLQRQGLPAQARQVFEHMVTMRNPAARHAGIIDLVMLQCVWNAKADPAAVRRMTTITGAKLQLAELLAFEHLGKYLHHHDCAGLTKAQLANIIVSTVDAAPQPDTLTQLWRSRFGAAQLYFLAGQRQKAINQTALAWMTGAADTAVGVYLANLYRVNGDPDSARLILRSVEKRVEPWDQRNLELIAQLKQMLGPVTATRE